LKAESIAWAKWKMQLSFWQGDESERRMKCKTIAIRSTPCMFSVKLLIFAIF